MTFTASALSKLNEIGRKKEFVPIFEEDIKGSNRRKFRKNKKARRQQRLKEKKRANKEPKQAPLLEKKMLRTALQGAISHSGSVDALTDVIDVIQAWEPSPEITQLFLEVVCYYRSVRKAVDWDQFAAITGLFLMGLCKNSVNIKEVVCSVLFKDKYLELDSLTGRDLPESQSGIDFTESMEILKNFRLLKDNELSRRVIQVIATAFSCGLVRGKKDLYLTNFNLNFIISQFLTSGDTVIDFFDALIGMFEFIVERGQICFQEGSITPLFMSDGGRDNYERDLADLLGYWPAVQAGNYNDTPYCSVPHFANALDNLFIATDKLVKQSKDSFSKRYHAKTLEKLNTIHARFKSQERSGGLREAPFSYLVYGKSSVGKSSIVATLTDFCLKSIALHKNPERDDYEVDPRMICSQNAKDKYDSDYRSYTLAVLFDDLANERVEVCKDSPLDAVIRYVNNIKSTALKADVHDKGVIQKEPWLVGCSTNIKNLQADQYTVEPISVLRRFHIHIEPVVATNYQTKDGVFLDGEKLANEDQAIPDAWRFNAYKYVYDTDKIWKQNKTNVTFSYTTAPFTFPGPDGKEYKSEDLDMEQLQWLINHLICKHFTAQQSVLKSNERIRKTKLCKHKVHNTICSLCNPNLQRKPLSNDPKKNVAICPIIEEAEDIDICSVVEEEEEIEDVTPTESAADLDLEGPESQSGITFIKTTLRCFFRGYLFFLWCCFWYGFWRDEIWAFIYGVEWRTRYINDATRFYARNWKNNVTHTINEINALRFIPWCFTDLLPNRWIDSPRFAWIYMFQYDRQYYPQLAYSAITLWILMAGFGRIMLKGNYTLYYLFAILGYVYLALLARKTYLMREMRRRRESVHDILRHTAKVAVGTSIQLMLTFGGIVVSYKLLKTMLWTIKKLGRISHGGDLDISAEEENVWLEARPKELPRCDPKTNTISSTHCRDIVSHNVTACYYDTDAWSSGVYVRSSVLLVPTHEVKNRGNFTLTLKRRNPKTLNAENLKLDITPDRMYHFSGKDITAVQHPRCPSKKNLTYLFPESIPTDRNPTKWIAKNKDGETITGSARRNGVAQTVPTNKTTLYDSTLVTYGEVTAGGDCLKVHVSDVRSKSHIVGFHLAGKGHTGYLTSLTRDDLETCYAHFNSNPATMLSADEGTMQTNLYDKDFTPIAPTNKKSTIHYLNDAEIEYYGHIPNFVTRPTSDVIKSPISESVKLHCGVENKYGKPAHCRDDETRVPKQAPYNIYLQGVGNATQEFPAELIRIAQADYLEDCQANAKMMQDLENLRPLTEIETISGQDGVKFVDSMKMSTSKGFPLSGSKEEIVKHLDPEEYSGISDPKIFEDVFMEDWRRVKALYLAGQRAYPIFKACPKDEPTKLTKSKVRIFQSAPLTLQCVIREFFLPIAACMSRHPISTECAVGINSQGPQWNKLMKHLSKFGEDRMVAGDFKAYDQHMSSTMTTAAFAVMIELAKMCKGYTEDDITIMRNLVADVVHPVICINGDLVELNGSNASGQNLTVYINSIVNSIYQRCVFYEIYPPGSLESTKFQDYVALMTYGDDNTMSVSKDAPKYNHTEMQKKYAERGIEYTMADKDAESVPYIDLKDTDFLKRATEFRPEYTDPATGENGMFLAKLSEDSIFKSLHCNMRSKVVSEEEVARQCLDGALRELWFYGREHFNMRHEQLKAVVNDHGWQHLISPNFYKTFDEREAEWLEKYNLILTESK